MKHIKLYEEFVESVSESKKFSDAFAVLDFFGGALPNDYSKALKATRKAGYDLPTSLYYEAADLAQDGVNEKREDIGKYNTVKKVVTENFPGPGETVDAKDLDNDMLDYFNRTNKVLSIDTKSKKGIKGSVGKMYGDLVFNGDDIKLKDIVSVKILESSILFGDFLNEEELNEKMKVFLKKIITNMVAGGFGIYSSPKMRDELASKIEDTVKDILIKYDYVVESKESEALANAINKSMIKIDKSMAYEDFALAVGKILKDEYGSHNFEPFMKVLHKDLGI